MPRAKAGAKRAVEEGVEGEQPPPAKKQAAKPKKAATAKKGASKQEEAAAGPSEAPHEAPSATKLQKLLSEKGIQSTINPEKPRKGWFEVRGGDKVHVSLQDMPRPFTKLKELDIDKLAADIASS
ncbi:hypothetical protein DUNSADRAFT_14878 [Dunaliella salina]|uniref:Selenoprotein H n=1 Tax=Dunaliella salina TaxID=3046 RepID=A0ABQ7G6H9_DUNSA|nr:hypothetical protein DUNSADRAFT_14878 [Dunaliella salina]|eukprot:KAF5830216.1 hypothetical protein DUNSADRAFT_14878 [Dunaliella salina]